MHAALAGAALVAACAPAKPAEPPPRATPLKLPDDATAIDFTFVSGSCWGTSVESRRVAIGEDGVVVSPAGFDGETPRSRGWWEKTRALLDAGLAHATAETPRGTAWCSGRPNFICGFDLAVTTPRGTTTLRGCCTERDAHNVETAFRRLRPGDARAADL